MTIDPERFAAMITKAIETATAPLLDRVQGLEHQVRGLMAQPPVGVTYAGTFEQHKLYQQGSLVTKGGSLWLALATTTNVPPGSNPNQWKLIVKKGEA